MRKIWCKIWNVILNLFTDAVEGIAYALKTVGTVAADVIGTVADSVGDALFGEGGVSRIFTIGLLGLGLWFLFGRNGDKESGPTYVMNGES